VKYLIQYVGRRKYLAGARCGLDVEDQPWRTAEGETVIGTEAQADEHAACLDADTDGEFVHRAVLAPEQDEIELAEPVKVPAPLAARRAS
jgi:hypothetical protein